jgi:hypothetical protein
MKRILISFLFLCLCYIQPLLAAGTSGLNFQTYTAGGAQPYYTQDASGNITNRTLISTGTVSTVNYNWGGGGVLTSGRGDGVIVRFYGYINIPTSGVYNFGGNADDGLRIKVNGISVVNSWIESGGDFRSGSISLSAGPTEIEVLYYENGGGALVNLQWFSNGNWAIIPSTSLATDSTYWVPPGPTIVGGTITQTNAPTGQTISSGGGSSVGITPAQQTRVNNWIYCFKIKIANVTYWDWRNNTFSFSKPNTIRTDNIIIINKKMCLYFQRRMLLYCR